MRIRINIDDIPVIDSVCGRKCSGFYTWQNIEIPEPPTCEDYACEDIEDRFDNPKFELNIIKPEDYTGNAKICNMSSTLGINKPLFDDEESEIKDELIPDFNFDICYDPNDGKWHNTVDEGKIKLNVVNGACMNTIESRFPNLIYSKNELSTIPNDMVCKALEDFKKQFTYGFQPEDDNEYMILEAIERHEEIHKEDFEKLIEDALKMKSPDNIFGDNEKYLDSFNLIEADCTEPINYNLIKSNSEKNFNMVLKSFSKILKDLWKSNVDPENEHYTQERSNYVIKDYIRILEDLHPNNNCN
ncbi:MAG: hypothetical protein PVH88_06380 [Ignavibacteria bacterium]|jgi:hypothetical protein